MSESLVKVENISKKFCRELRRSLWYGLMDMGAELTGRSREKTELREREFWAVKDVSFELRRGECLGLIGRNGAGKSTLLKMLNGLLKPDRGRIELRGRVGALIELGAGFNPVLTGRENIYINGSVLGFSKAEIDRKFDAIAAFAELDDFLDTPVQYYSSGMKVRLGFAVASQMEPDILLIDEVLAVGDLGFKVKCYNEIYRIMKNAAIIFVSHSMQHVAKVCTRGILLQAGATRLASPDISEIVRAYYDLFEGDRATLVCDGRARFLSLSFGNKGALSTFAIDELVAQPRAFRLDSQEDVVVEMALEVDGAVGAFAIHVAISDMEQKWVSQAVEHRFQNAGKALVVRALFSNLMLNTGNYYLNIFINESHDTLPQSGHLAMFWRILKISVGGPAHFGIAPLSYPCEWTSGGVS